MKIDKSTHQGYLWYSDEKEPRVFNNEEFELEMAENTNPFIVEGHLFDGINSISIKYVDGKYIINKYVVKKDDFKSPNVIKEFLPFLESKGIIEIVSEEKFKIIDLPSNRL